MTTITSPNGLVHAMPAFVTLCGIRSTRPSRPDTMHRVPRRGWKMTGETPVTCLRCYRAMTRAEAAQVGEGGAK